MKIGSTSRSLVFAALTACLAACGAADAEDQRAPDEIGTVRSALVTVVVEGEAATGAGTVENDPAASGGQVRVLTVVGSTATAAFSTVGAMQSGTVRVRAACSGASIQVLVDGNTATTTSVPTSWTDLPLSVAGYGAGPHTIGFKYRNGPTGCALRVDAATLTTADPPPPPPPPITIEAEAATGAGTVGSDPGASGGQYRQFTTVYSTASATFTSSGTLASGSVRVRSAGTCSSMPWVKVTVDGTQFISAQLPATGWVDMGLQVTPFAAGSHTAVFEYRYGPAGCALQVDRLRLNQQ